MSEDPTTVTAPEDPWAALWAGTRQGSWDLLGEDPAALALRGHWTDQCSWLRNTASVADVGSGPAVLARLLMAGMDAASKPLWHCIDQAQIPSEALQDMERMESWFGRPFEQLTPPGGGVDALISNFGLEYVRSDLRASCCAQWLPSGGKLHVVMHAQGSVIDTQSSLGQSDLALILDELDFPERVAALIKAKVSAPADPVARMMHGLLERDEFNEAVNRLKSPLEDRGNRAGPLYEWLMISRQMVQEANQGNLESGLKRLVDLRAAYSAERSRLNAMRSVALSQVDLQRLGSDLVSAGFQGVGLSSLEVHSGQVAWIVDALKS